MNELYWRSLEAFYDDKTSLIAAKLDKLKDLNESYLSSWHLSWRPLLASAAHLDDIEFLYEVIRRGPDVNQRYDHKNPVNKTISKQLTAAMEVRNSEAMRALIVAGADLKARNADGHSVFYFAAKHNVPSLVETLIAYDGVGSPDEVAYFVQRNEGALRQDAKTGGSISKVALARKAQLHGMRIALEKCVEVAK